jgi:autotransporter-associated beta strand protein
MTFQALILKTLTFQLLVLLAFITNHAVAANQTASNQSAATLDKGAAWVSGNAPGSGDWAIWNGTYTPANLTNSLNANVTWGGIAVSNVIGAPIEIQPGSSTLTLEGLPTGASMDTIDMSAATIDLTVACQLQISGGGTNYFTVPAGRTFTYGSSSPLYLGYGNLQSTPAELMFDGGGNYVMNGPLDTYNRLSGEPNWPIYVMNGTGKCTLNGTGHACNFMLNSGTLNIDNLYAINAYAGQTLTINGGTIDTTVPGGMNLNNSGQPPFYNWNGNFTYGGTYPLYLGTGAVTLGQNVQLTCNGGSTLTAQGAIGDGGHGYGLTKAGTGTLSLTAVNSYTGATTISAGTLTLSSGASIASAAIVIAGGGTLNTSAAGDMALGAAQALGASGSITSGILETAVGNGLSLNNNSPLQFTAFKPAASGGVVPLTLSGSGTLTLGASTPVTITVVNGGTALTSAGSPYKLIAKGTSGTVATLPGGTLTINGDGANGTPSLSINNGELYLVLSSSSAIYTTTAVAMTSGSPTYGNSLVFTAALETNNIVAANATGNYVFLVDGTAVMTNVLSSGSANFTATLAAGNHSITAQYSGGGNYDPSSYTLAETVNPLVVGLTGIKAYDGTSYANYAILTITNIVGEDNVFPASGSVGLVGNNAGEQAITSPNTLTLGGAQATNYTVTGLMGAVLITKNSNTFLALTSSSQTNAYSIPVAFSATILANGAPAVNATGSVTFLTNGVVFCASNLVNGTAYTPYLSNLPVGTNIITAEYTGDGNYFGCTNSLNQLVMQQTSDVTFSNSLVAITWNPSGTITMIVREDTGENKDYESPGFYIWNEQYGTKISFAQMVQIAPNQMLFSTADGHYNVTIQVTSNTRYLKFALLNVSDCPSGGLDTNWPGLSVAFNIGGFNYYGQTNDGWNIDAVTLDPMVDMLTANPVFVLWPYVQYSQGNAYAYPYVSPNNQTTNGYPLQPMGAVAIFTPTNAAQHDDILYDIWTGETSLPEPNRAHLTNGWNRATAQEWMARWESLPPARLLMFIPTDLNDLYATADIMQSGGLNGLYLFDYYWKGNSVDSINTNLFPNGLSDVTALEEYCAARGISLYFHWSSVFVSYGDPLYGANSPTGISPDLASWGTGTLLSSVNSGSTSFNVQPDPGCQLMIDPPPWGGYDQWSAFSLSDSYPPYYTSVFSPIMNINNDLMFGSTTAVNPTNWDVSGVNRSGVSQFGSQWGESHSAGSRVDFLLSEGGSFVPDSRSVLFTNLAVGFANLVNQEQIPEADYDSLEQNQDLGNWGPRRESQALYEALDHPVHANSSFGAAPWGHFEYNFDSVKTHDGGGGFAIESSEIGGLAELRLWDPSLMATHIDEDNWAYGCAAGYSPNFMISGYHVGTTLQTITNQGWWSQMITNMNLWQALAPYLTTNEQATLKTFGTNFYVPSATNGGWLLTPTEAMLRAGVDNPWQLMTESGPISPHQFIQVGETLSSLNNPFAAQTPQIELLVLPSMTATNASNVSLLPTSPLYFTSTTPYNWKCTQFGNGAPVNMSQSRGVAFTITGDNSGSVLVLNIGGRYYAVTVNFSGMETIEVPNGEVELYRSDTSYGWQQTGQIGTFDYTNVGNFSLYLGYVPPGVNPNIEVSEVQTMQENQTIGLVNPTLTLNGVTANISGTIPYNDYVVYGGGSTANEYDPNWNFITTLSVSGSTLTAENGLNTFSVSAPSSPNTFMATRVKVSGTPWVINKPAPTHEWRFEDNTLDSVGMANGTAINGPAYVPGIEGVAALSFNGVNQYVSITNIPDFQFTSTQSFTFSAWVKLNSLPNAMASIVQKDPAGGTWYGLGITAANQWAFFGATDIVSSITADAGQWHLLVAVQDATAGSRKLYVDGLLISIGMAQDASGTGAMGIGAAPGSDPAQFLKGSVDDVRLYNQALAQPDISLLAKNLAAPANSILTYSVRGGQLVLDWPANQLWQLQTQTNNLATGLTANWFPVTGAFPPYTVDINSVSPTVFYRLTHP